MALHTPINILHVSSATFRSTLQSPPLDRLTEFVSAIPTAEAHSLRHHLHLLARAVYTWFRFVWEGIAGPCVQQCVGREPTRLVLQKVFPSFTQNGIPPPTFSFDKTSDSIDVLRWCRPDCHACLRSLRALNECPVLRRVQAPERATQQLETTAPIW